MSYRTSKPESNTTFKRYGLGFAEIALVCTYFFAVWMIPTKWLDTAIGAIVFAITSKINVYLWDYSISFALNPEWFIHCQVMATLIGSWLFPLMVKARGGLAEVQKEFALGAEQCGGLILFWLRSGALILFLSHSMLTSVTPYLNSKPQYLIWGSEIGVCVSALLYASALSLGVGISYVCLKIACSNK